MKDSPSRLEIDCFGFPRVRLDARPVLLERRKSLALLVYLAVTQSSASRLALTALFWPEADPRRASANLRIAVWEINQKLGEGWLIAERDNLSLDFEQLVVVDVLEFRRSLVQAADAGLHVKSRQDLLIKAVGLFPESFLAGFSLKDASQFDEWVFFENENLKAQLSSALDELVSLLQGLGDAEEAISYARRRLSLDALDESAHRCLMQSYAQAGQLNAALRQYQECVRLLLEELGVEPDPETQALYQQIRSIGRQPASAPTPQVGIRLKNRYQLEELVGTGSMGLVFRAQDARLERSVAIKILQERAAGTEARQRLLHEARTTARLNHPNIVSIFDADESDGMAYIVMEYITGQSLRQVAPSSLNAILPIISQVCTALAYAHSQGVLHRDLKPENILLNGGFVKLMDFGLACSIRETVSSMDGFLVGTPAYIAPELLEGQEADNRSDLYALGVILYELVTGNLPFGGDNLADLFSRRLTETPAKPSQIRLDLPTPLEDLILRLLARQPADRYQNAQAVLDALGELRQYKSHEELPERKRNNLPAMLTSFVGRERELEELQAELNPSAGQSGSTSLRLLTLIGPGGTGKTRLSLQAASTVLDFYPDGVWLIELAPLADPVMIPRTIAVALGLREEPGRPIQDTLLDFLHTRCLLMILDNCEHMVEACALLVENLLQRCPELRILASSREALGVPGERVLRVRPLDVPPVQAAFNELSSWLQYDSVRLFIDRATAVQPGIILDITQAAQVAHICARLDGIPLAIELAAARLPALAVEQILQRLDDRFRLLTGGSRTALPRHQTLRALIDWSYDLLPPSEQALLRGLAVFAGGWDLDAAESILVDWSQEEWPAEPNAPLSILDGLSRLINKSLVIAEQHNSRGMRYRLLETIRQYASEKLIQAGEAATIRSQHLLFYAALAEQAEDKFSTADSPIWFERISVEIDNIRSALEWAAKADVRDGLRLASALLLYWWVHLPVSEGLDWLNLLLEKPHDPVPDPVWAKALLAAADTLTSHSESRSFAEAALEMYRQLGDEDGQGKALRVLGITLCIHDEYYLGRRYFIESLDLCRRLGDRKGVAASLGVLGIFSEQKDDPLARQRMRESLAMFRELGDLGNMLNLLDELADYAIWNRDFDEAQACLNEVLEIQRQLNMPDWVVNVGDTLGRLAYHRGDYPKARDYFERAVDYLDRTGQAFSALWSQAYLGYTLIWQGMREEAHRNLLAAQDGFLASGSTLGLVFCLEGVAHLSAAHGDYARAVSLVAFGNTVRKTVGDQRPPVEQAEIDRTLAAACCLIDDAAREEAEELGKGMSVEEAVRLAREIKLLLM